MLNRPYTLVCTLSVLSCSEASAPVVKPVQHPAGIIAGTVPIVGGSASVAIRDDGTFVTSRFNNDIQIGSASGLNVTGEVPGVLTSTSLALSADGTIAYAADDTSGISAIDIASHTAAKIDFERGAAGSIAMDESRGLLYLPASGPRVVEFDLATRTVRRRLAITGDPNHLGLINRVLRHPTRDVYYAGNYLNVMEVDVTTGAVLRNFPIGGSGSDMFLSPDGNLLYVATAPLGNAVNIAIINLVTGVIEPPIILPLGLLAHMVMTPDSKQFWVTCYNDSKLVVVDRETRTVVQTIVVPPHPDQIAISPNGLIVAVASGAGVTIIR